MPDSSLDSASHEKLFTHRVVYEVWYMTAQEDRDVQEQYRYCYSLAEAEEFESKIKALPRTSSVTVEQLLPPVEPNLVNYWQT